MTRPLLILFFAFAPAAAMAAGQPDAGGAGWTSHWVGILCLAIFAVSYLAVTTEEALHLRKSVPVTLGAGLIWLLVGIAFTQSNQQQAAADALRHNALEFGELFLFLLAAMTYVNTMEERQVFDCLRAWLVGRGLSLRALFWLTGALAFVISPVADNLTTALVMGAVAIAVGGSNARFVSLSCINIVVAANAGGAFSPFGDITTLMVWQAGMVSFGEFFKLVIPSLVNWLVPAAIMSIAIDRGRPDAAADGAKLRPGGLVVVAMFLATIAFTVVMHQFTHLPPFIGMTTGLGALKLYSYILDRRSEAALREESHPFMAGWEHDETQKDSFDIFRILTRVEWDTLMFFYGVILCVGGLGTLGYLAALSTITYGGLGPTWANVLVGLLSAVIDNIPVMFAVLSMKPEMSHSQWLLVTLTAGVGGSLLSIGSAAGVALMGHARGVYTFMSHLKWSWAVALGYVASILAHLLINGK